MGNPQYINEAKSGRANPLYVLRANSFPSSNKRNLIMKKTQLLASALSTVALAAAVLIAVGCQKNENAGNPPPNTARAPAEKNSFQEVTSHLDAGGSVYVDLSTDPC